MIVLGTSRREEAAQNRREARGYLHAYRQCRDAGLRRCYRQLFRTSLGLARALERVA